MNKINNKNEIRKKTILALSQAKGIGYYTIRKLYSTHKNLEDLKNYPLTELLVLFKQAKIKYAERLANSFFSNKEKLFEKAETITNNLFTKRKIQLILDNEPAFPRSLQNIPDKPFWLFVEGNFNILDSQKNIAVIGTRHPTAKGIKIAEELTKYLIEKDYIIVSGLAEGIDETAHKITNQLNGKGIAILGCGINSRFPASTFKTRETLISKGGAVISEYMINDFYSKQSFVWRDRLQSGLSKAVFPIQGTLNSGTLHTIKFAEQQKKKIIGVYMKEIDKVGQNEIFEYLEQKGHSIYDLVSDVNKIIATIEKTHKDIAFPEQQDLFGTKEKPKEKFSEKKKKGLFGFIQKLLERIKQWA